MLVEPSKTTGRADAEMLEIVQHLLLSSPPGEFDEVWYDAQILVPKLISPQILAGIARAYNHENLSVAKTADGLRAAGQRSIQRCRPCGYHLLVHRLVASSTQDHG